MNKISHIFRLLRSYKKLILVGSLFILVSLISFLIQAKNRLPLTEKNALRRGENVKQIKQKMARQVDHSSVTFELDDLFYSNMSDEQVEALKQALAEALPSLTYFGLTSDEVEVFPKDNMTMSIFYIKTSDTSVYRIEMLYNDSETNVKIFDSNNKLIYN